MNHLEIVLEKLQKELVPWQQHNFPNRPSWVPLLGTVEELGELQESIEVAMQNEVEDAIADLIVFLADYCNGIEISLFATYSNEKNDKWILEHNVEYMALLTKTIGRLAHSHIKSFQKIRVSESHREEAIKAAGQIVSILEQWCSHNSVELHDIVSYTWNKVKQRDWIKFPNNGKDK